MNETYLALSTNNVADTVVAMNILAPIATYALILGLCFFVIFILYDGESI